MKKLFTYLLLLLASSLIGCTQPYDDTEVRKDIENLKERVAALEKLCKEMNANIDAMAAILEALETHDYITGVTPITKDGETVGYTITFAKGEPITIYNGEDGKDGVDGVDGYTPVIGVAQDSDGVYYWTLDGEWLLDDAGNKIKAVGIDGKDGADGEDGKDGADGEDGKDGENGADGTDGKDGVDGITPQLKIENEYWYISYDNGATWIQLGKATGEDGKDGANGSDGADGKDGDSFFEGVDTSNDDYVVFTLADGTTIKIPTWYAFEQLKKQCEEMNQNITAMQQILEALQNNDYVTSVQQIVEDGKTIGYTIYFSKSSAVTIYHGEDGKDGADGTDGVNGADGKDGHSPIVGVRQASDGIYYWTLDGEWLLDDAGNKIKAVGIDGKDGQDGEDGKDGQDGADGTDGVDGENGADGKDGVDGITPQLKIENQYWCISYDNGTTWTQLGKATGEDGADGMNGDSFFQSVTQDEQYVYFTLADGTQITLPKGAMLSISFDASDLVVMTPNSTREIGYSVQSVTESVTVEVISSSDIRAKVVSTSADGKSGNIVVTSSGVVDEYSKVIVFVSNGEKVIMKSIGFEQAGITISNGAEQTIGAEGGSVNLNFASNIDWEVAIPTEAQSWIQVAPQTRAMVTYTVVLNIAPNTTLSERSAAIKIISTDGNLSISYTISQGVFDNVMVTTVNDSGWKTDDSISIFAATSINQRYTYYGASGVTTGAFLAPKSETDLPATIDAYYAIYPYNASYALNADGEIVNTFASEQKYIADGYKWDYNLMVGASSGVDDKNITLSPVCAYLCVRLYGKEQIIKSITINSKGGEAFAGSALITPSNEGAHRCAMTGSIDNIKLNCGEVLLAETADAASEFWFVVPPVALASGYSVKVAGFYGGEQAIDFPATTFASGAIYNISAEVTVSTNGPGMGVGGWGDGENVEGEI